MLRIKYISFRIFTSPRIGSGLLTTADSETAGCCINALSTSNGPIRYLGEKFRYDNHSKLVISLFFSDWIFLIKTGKQWNLKAADLPSRINYIISSSNKPDISFFIHNPSVSSDVKVSSHAGSSFLWVILITINSKGKNVIRTIS